MQHRSIFRYFQFIGCLVSFLFEGCGPYFWPLNFLNTHDTHGSSLHPSTSVSTVYSKTAEGGKKHGNIHSASQLQENLQGSAFVRVVEGVLTPGFFTVRLKSLSLPSKGGLSSPCTIGWDATADGEIVQLRYLAAEVTSTSTSLVEVIVIVFASVQPQTPNTPGKSQLK